MVEEEGYWNKRKDEEEGYYEWVYIKDLSSNFVKMPLGEIDERHK